MGRKRKPVKTLLINMTVGGTMTCLDVVKLPRELESDSAAIGDLASSYKHAYLKKNPQFKREQFSYQVKSLR